MDNDTKFSKLTLTQILSINYRSAAIFEKYNLDISSLGGKTIKEACKEAGIQHERVLSDLASLDSLKIEIPVRVDEWELDFLVDYIINNHHRYVRNIIPVITMHLEKVVSAHGKRHAETIEALKIFSVVYKEFKQHMMKEEEILFPYIKYLVKVKNGENKFEKPYFGRIANPINMMELEHQSAGENMYTIRRLFNNYTPPADACETYRVTLRELKEFEEDHHKHIHLENNILFPKAVILEEQLMTGQAV